jgi:hypothetical protein
VTLIGPAHKRPASAASAPTTIGRASSARPSSSSTRSIRTARPGSAATVRGGAGAVRPATAAGQAETGARTRPVAAVAGARVKSKVVESVADRDWAAHGRASPQYFPQLNSRIFGLSLCVGSSDIRQSGTNGLEVP